MFYTSRISIAIALSLSIWGAANPANAQEKEQNEDHIFIGAGVLLEKDPFVDSETRAYPIPLISIKQGAYYFEGTETGVQFDTKLGGVKPSIDLFLAGRFRTGQDREKITADVGARLSLATDYGTLSASYQRDITGTFNGGEAIVRYSLPISAGSVTITPAVQASWLDKKTTNYMYGVTAGQRTKMTANNRDTILPLSHIDDDAINLGGDITVAAQLSDHLMLYGAVSGTYLDKSIRYSAAIDQKWEAQAIMGVAYKF